jgi:hypothetical protein
MQKIARTALIHQSQLEQIARVCHEANRAYCATLGDGSQLSWEAAPEWQKDSARKGVEFHFSHLAIGVKPSPSASHDSWLEQKRAEGWKFGATKNPETKEHPCFVAYDELPLEQRRKDYIFAAICEAFYNSAVREVAA